MEVLKRTLSSLLVQQQRLPPASTTWVADNFKNCGNRTDRLYSEMGRYIPSTISLLAMPSGAKWEAEV
jgi:hypothetical protein